MRTIDDELTTTSDPQAKPLLQTVMRHMGYPDDVIENMLRYVYQHGDTAEIPFNTYERLAIQRAARDELEFTEQQQDRLLDEMIGEIPTVWQRITGGIFG